VFYAKDYYSAIGLDALVFSEARRKIYFRFRRTNERVFAEAIPFLAIKQATFFQSNANIFIPLNVLHACYMFQPVRRPSSGMVSQEHIQKITKVFLHLFSLLRWLRLD